MESTVNKGPLASKAVDCAICQIMALRLNNPYHLDRIVFCFPRVISEPFNEWQDGSPYLAGVVDIARNPENPVYEDIPIKHYADTHSIPSLIVPVNGIRDVEYHVSRQNMERLLAVGCIVFQPYRKGFGVRIPRGHPLLSGQPFGSRVDASQGM